jgi:hypothetical protein
VERAVELGPGHFVIVQPAKFIGANASTSYTSENTIDRICAKPHSLERDIVFREFDLSHGPSANSESGNFTRDR